MTVTNPAHSTDLPRPRRAGNSIPGTAAAPAMDPAAKLSAVNVRDPRLPGRVALLRGDAAALPMPDESVDLIVTSPPYWAQRSYTDGGEHYLGQIGDEPNPREYITALLGCTAEWTRVLKPSGSIFVNLGDKYATRYSSVRGSGRAGFNADDGTRRRTGQNRTGSPEKSLLLLPERYRIGCVDQLGLIARAVLVWDKPNGLPESVTDRVRRSHEDWVHLTKQARYFSDLDAIREQPARWDPPRPLGTRNKTQHHATATDNTGWKDRPVAQHPRGRLPGSVWEVATRPLKVPADLGVGHYASFPMEWPRRLILGWSPAGGVVLDPFGGTGTTALVAAALNRTGVSLDRSADYTDVVARWRTSDPLQIAQALGKRAGSEEIAGQGDLLAGMLP